jgi:N-acetylmuramoyl-L-alanine amidase
MTMIILDRQHAGKPHRPTDMGAHHDLDGDGLAELHETEAYFTAIYGLAAEIRLRSQGYQVVPMSHGTYPERHDYVNTRLPDARVYVAMHLNAGSPKRGKEYSAVFYDYRSAPERGKALAESIDAQLAQIEQIGGNRRIWSTSKHGWKKNAHSTIRGVERAIGICFEPLFIDGPRHAKLMTVWGMQQIGNALADGIHNYLSGGGVA